MGLTPQFKPTISFPFRYNKDGTKHYFGQIYKPKKHKERLFNTNPICQICLKTINDIEQATLDHIIPRAHGGHTTYNNIQLAHMKCNQKKGAQLPDGYYAADNA